MLTNAITNRKVSLDDVVSAIQSSHYFTAADGVYGEGIFSNTLGSRHSDRAQITQTSPALGVLTFCVLVLKNGFTVTGQSACVDPNAFDEDIGRGIAYENAVKQIWPLLGFTLRDALNRESQFLKDRAFEAQPGFGVYLGTKVVHAHPMSRQVYNDFRGWTMPANEKDDEGYLIEYTDRVESHVEGYQGYISWSPKDVFEDSYRVIKIGEGV